MYLVSGYSYIGSCILECVNIGFWLVFLFCRISTLKWIAGIKVTNNLFINQNTFWANELDNSTDLLELNTLVMLSLLMYSFISDLFFLF